MQCIPDYTHLAKSLINSQQDFDVLVKKFEQICNTIPPSHKLDTMICKETSINYLQQDSMRLYHFLLSLDPEITIESIESPSQDSK